MSGVSLPILGNTHEGVSDKGQVFFPLLLLATAASSLSPAVQGHR